MERVDAETVVRMAQEARLRLVRFLWCGNDGTIRAKASGLHGLEARVRSGIGVTVAMQAMNGLDQLQPVEGMGPVGESRLVPDLDTFRVCPTPRGPARDRRPARPRRGARALSASARSSSAWEPAWRSGPAARGRVRERVLARDGEDDGLRARRREPLLLHDRHDGVAGLRRRARGGARGAGHPRSSSTTPSSATGSRRSPRRTRRRSRRPTTSCSCARRSAASPRARARRLARARSPGPTRRGNGCTSTSRSGTARRNRFYDRLGPTGSPTTRARSSPACSSTCPACAG